jgi:hypothetical protein
LPQLSLELLFAYSERATKRLLTINSITKSGKKIRDSPESKGLNHGVRSEKGLRVCGCHHPFLKSGKASEQQSKWYGIFAFEPV